MAGTFDRDGTFRFHRYALTDPDLGADVAGCTQLFRTEAKAYVTALALHDDITCFLLDRRCQDILIARDTDGDTWPDAVDPVSFAHSANHPELLAVRDLTVNANPRAVVTAKLRLSGTGALRALDAGRLRTFVDTDGDGVADEVRVTGADRPRLGMSSLPTLVRTDPMTLLLAGGDLTLEGHGFTGAMVVVLECASGTVERLPCRIIDATRAVARVPRLAHADAGEALLRLCSDDVATRASSTLPPGLVEDE